MLHQRRQDTTLHISFAQNLTSTWMTEFRQACTKLDLNGIKAIHLDFADVTQIDSIGLGMLVFMNNHIPKHIEIQITGAMDTIQAILDISHLPQLFGTRAETEDEDDAPALASLG